MTPFTLAVKSDVVGKVVYSFGDNWYNRDFENARAILEWTYVKGHAIAQGAVKEAGKKKNDTMVSTSLIILDFDKLPSNTTYQDLLKHDLIKAHALIIKPSSSHTPQAPKYHVFINIRSLATPKAHKEAFEWVAALFEESPYKPDPAMATFSQGVAGTRFTQEPLKGRLPALDDGLCYWNDKAAAYRLPIRSGLSNQKLADRRNRADEPNRAGIADVHTPTPLERRERGHSAIISESASTTPHPTQKNATDEYEPDKAKSALDFLLKNWGWREYPEWLNLYFSAYAAFSGDEEIARYIAYHEGIAWPRNEDRAAFLKAWAAHKPKSNGITGGTLFHMAAAEGWQFLYKSPSEISDFEAIDTQDIEEWMSGKTVETLQRALIVSGMGSGKTQGAISHWVRLFTGGKVQHGVFFAPTIRLCAALSSELTKRGIEHTYYRDKSGATLPDGGLVAGNLLVTTLQTFANKLCETQWEQFDFVAIDESDELISGFILGGTTLTDRSHISSYLARKGLQALARLCAAAHTVLMLDGTATKVSQRILEDYSKESGLRGHTYKNLWRRDKAAVAFIEHKDRSKIIPKLIEKYAHTRIVIACDTKTEVKSLKAFFEENYPHKNLIAIYGCEETEAEIDTSIRFFENVNKQAALYDVIIYNSAAGSGISVTDIEAETLIQICAYLPARKNLQLLNRFRRQGNVFILFKPYHMGKNRAQDLLKAREMWVRFYTLADASQTHNDEIFALIYDDTRAQEIDRRQFYEALIKDDGRKIIEPPQLGRGGAGAYKPSTDDKEAAIALWRDVPRLTKDDPPPRGMSAIEVIAGRLHEDIYHWLGEVGIEASKDEPAARVYQVAKRFSKALFLLRELDNPITSIVQSDLHILKRGDLHKLKMARPRLQLSVGFLSVFKESTELPENDFMAVAAPLNSFIDKNPDLWKVTFPRQQGVPPTLEKRLKAIANLFGLGLQKRRGGYSLKHFDELKEFRAWQKRDVPFLSQEALNESIDFCDRMIKTLTTFNRTVFRSGGLSRDDFYMSFSKWLYEPFDFLVVFPQDSVLRQRIEAGFEYLKGVPSQGATNSCSNVFERQKMQRKFYHLTPYIVSRDI